MYQSIASTAPLVQGKAGDSGDILQDFNIFCVPGMRWNCRGTVSRLKSGGNIAFKCRLLQIFFFPVHYSAVEQPTIAYCSSIWPWGVQALS